MPIARSRRHVEYDHFKCIIYKIRLIKPVELLLAYCILFVSKVNSTNGCGGSSRPNVSMSGCSDAVTLALHHAMDNDSSSEQLDCCLCLAPIPVAAVRLAPCGHNVFCAPCIIKLHLHAPNAFRCPLCRASITQVHFLAPFSISCAASTLPSEPALFVLPRSLQRYLSAAESAALPSVEPGDSGQVNFLQARMQRFYTSTVDIQPRLLLEPSNESEHGSEFVLTTRMQTQLTPPLTRPVE